jgi:hypothetical protein
MGGGTLALNTDYWYGLSRCNLLIYSNTQPIASIIDYCIVLLSAVGFVMDDWAAIGGCGYVWFCCYVVILSTGFICDIYIIRVNFKRIIILDVL